MLLVRRRLLELVVAIKKHNVSYYGQACCVNCNIPFQPNNGNTRLMNHTKCIARLQNVLFIVFRPSLLFFCTNVTSTLQNLFFLQWTQKLSKIGDVNALLKRINWRSQIIIRAVCHGPNIKPSCQCRRQRRLKALYNKCPY